jgi:hypothetical protein
VPPAVADDGADDEPDQQRGGHEEPDGAEVVTQMGLDVEGDDRGRDRHRFR